MIVYKQIIYRKSNANKVHFKLIFDYYVCVLLKLRFLQVKKRQQRVLMILDSKNIQYEIIDITEPGKEAEKEFMQENSTNKGATISDQTPRHALPPQIFSDSEYCGNISIICIDL